MGILIVAINNPDNLNLIFGQSHFIKTVEDLHEIIIGSVPQAEFGLAFSEASGPRLVRTSGNNKNLEKLAGQNLFKMGAGHSFLIFLKNCFPINILSAIKHCAEVVTIFCATSNPVEVILYGTKQGRAILGIIDGRGPMGIEKEEDKQTRKDFLRKIGYKL